MGHSHDEMKTLLKTTTDIGKEKSLKFDPSKNATVIFKTVRLGEPRGMLIQGKHIEVQDHFKGLRITVCDAPDDLLQQENIWKKDTHGVLQLMHD